MNDKKEFDLLTDLAKLIKKYGPEVFDNLAIEISKPEFSQHLAQILSTISKASRSVQTGNRQTETKQSRTNFRSSLLELETLDSEKGVILSQLYDGLITKTFLPTWKDMKIFVADNGLPSLKATSRDKAIIPFVKMFIPMPLEQVKLHLQKIQPVSSNDDRSLEGWSNIIFGREGQNK